MLQNESKNRSSDTAEPPTIMFCPAPTSLPLKCIAFPSSVWFWFPREGRGVRIRGKAGDGDFLSACATAICRLLSRLE